MWPKGLVAVTFLNKRDKLLERRRESVRNTARLNTGIIARATLVVVRLQAQGEGPGEGVTGSGVNSFNYCANWPKGTRIDRRLIHYSIIYSCHSQHVTSLRARDIYLIPIFITT